MYIGQRCLAQFFVGGQRNIEFLVVNIQKMRKTSRTKYLMKAKHVNDVIHDS